MLGPRLLVSGRGVWRRATSRKRRHPRPENFARAERGLDLVLDCHNMHG